MFVYALATLSCWLLVVKSQPHNSIIERLNSKHGFLRNEVHSPVLPPLSRSKRTTDHRHMVTECIFMTSDEGEFFHTATDVDGSACGIFMYADPDQRIEVHFNYVDIPCENGGLISFIDGWELNGEFFPSPYDHPLPMKSRFSEFCGPEKVKPIFNSSQNVALIQYRMPARGTSFSFTVRFVKNPTPCNILFQNTEDVLTLRNYGKRSNCSISTLVPAAVRVLALDVGVVAATGRSMEIETGTLHKCHKRGLEDYVQIGGSSGLDSSNLELADAVCGMNSRPGRHVEKIFCETTTVRLVSSGAFENSVTVHIRSMGEEDIDGYMSVYCDI